MFRFVYKKKGLDFPKILSEKWLSTRTLLEDGDTIDDGLKLGS